MTMKKTALATAVTLLLGAGPAAHAQSSGGGSSAGVQTITITSQKRKEDIREVPLSVSVMSGDAMQDGHVNDFSDLSRAIPNLSFSTQAGAGLATLQLRGVSSQAGSATVSIYLDDISLTTRNLYSQGTAEPRFFDVDRVEVLRGPQGTLYGASSLGGTIKFISKQPDATRYEGGAYSEISSTSHGGTNYNLQGVINVPLSKDVLGLRVGVQSGKNSGYIDQVDVNTLGVINKGINETRWDVVKLAAKAQLSKDWTLTPALFYQRYKSNDIDAAYEAVGDYQSANVGAPLGKFQTSKIVREPGTDTLTVPSATLTGDLGFADLTGILSGYKRRFMRDQDGTSINVPYIASVISCGNGDGDCTEPADVPAQPALGAKVAAMPSAVQLDNRIDQTSLEVRLASKDYKPGGTPWTWIGGAYFAKTKTQVYDNEPIFGINAAFSAANVNINDPNQFVGAFQNDFTGDSSYYSARHYDDRQSSVFGEVTYHASASLRLLAGLRLLRASQHFTREGDLYYAGGPSTALIDSSASASTPRFAIDWDLDKDNTLYANVAKGFRLGSANRPIPSPAQNSLVGVDLTALGLVYADIPAAFKPDSLWSYEVGAKSRFLDGRLAVSVALFYLDWKDIQQDVSLKKSGYDFETNVGRAKSYGFEFEAKLKATEALTLNASAGATNATFSQDSQALGFDSAGDLNVRKGDRVQGVPRFSAGLGFEYRFTAFGSNSAFVRSNGQWTGASRGDLKRDSSDFERPGYFTADAGAGITIDRWEFTAFAKNMFNNDSVIQRPNIQGVTTVYHLRPRTIGLTARYDF